PPPGRAFDIGSILGVNLGEVAGDTGLDLDRVYGLGAAGDGFVVGDHLVDGEADHHIWRLGRRRLLPIAVAAQGRDTGHEWDQQPAARADSSHSSLRSCPRRSDSLRMPCNTLSMISWASSAGGLRSPVK